MDMPLVSTGAMQGRVSKALTNVMVAGVVVVILGSIGLSMAARPSALSGSVAQGEQIFDIRIPDRSSTFALATGSGGTTPTTSDNSGPGPVGVQDGRVGGNAAVAALTAIYPGSNGGFDVYAIDPVTGQGQKAFSFSPTDVANAVPDSTNQFGRALIVPAPFTLEQMQAMNPRVYVFRHATGPNDCVVETTYPDGKTAVYGFPC